MNYVIECQHKNLQIDFFSHFLKKIETSQNLLPFPVPFKLKYKDNDQYQNHNTLSTQLYIKTE